MEDLNLEVEVEDVEETEVDSDGSFSKTLYVDTTQLGVGLIASAATTMFTGSKFGLLSGVVATCYMSTSEEPYEEEVTATTMVQSALQGALIGGGTSLVAGLGMSMFKGDKESNAIDSDDSITVK